MDCRSPSKMRRLNVPRDPKRPCKFASGPESSFLVEIMVSRYLDPDEFVAVAAFNV